MRYLRLVKVYVVEAESTAVKGLVAASEVVAVCRIAWAEAFAAFSRRAREAPADAAALDDARRALARDWPQLLVLEVTQPVVEQAGEFADTFALRAYDAVQLAAAHCHGGRSRAARLRLLRCAPQQGLSRIGDGGALRSVTKKPGPGALGRQGDHCMTGTLLANTLATAPPRPSDKRSSKGS